MDQDLARQVTTVGRRFLPTLCSSLEVKFQSLMLFHFSQTLNRGPGWRTSPQTSTSSSLDQTPPGPAPPTPAASNTADNVSHAFSACVGVAVDIELHRNAEPHRSNEQLLDWHQTESISRMSMMDDSPPSLLLDLQPTPTRHQSNLPQDAEMRKPLPPSSSHQPLTASGQPAASSINSVSLIIESLA